MVNVNNFKLIQILHFILSLVGVRVLKLLALTDQKMMRNAQRDQDVGSPNEQI
jgi:hypothetical protein